jgi:hypothetical protein
MDFGTAMLRRGRGKEVAGFILCLLGFAIITSELLMLLLAVTGVLPPARAIDTLMFILAILGQPLILFPLTLAGLVLTEVERRQRWSEPGQSSLSTASLVMGCLVFPLTFLLFGVLDKYGRSDQGKGTGMNDSAAVGSVRTVATAEEQYLATYGSYSRALEELGSGSQDGKCVGSSATAQHACLIDYLLSSGQKAGYRFLYVPGAPDQKGRIVTYSFMAQPLKYGRTGSKNFFVDQTGVIRAASKDRQATVNDPALGE